MTTIVVFTDYTKNSHVLCGLELKDKYADFRINVLRNADYATWHPKLRVPDGKGWCIRKADLPTLETELRRASIPYEIRQYILPHLPLVCIPSAYNLFTKKMWADRDSLVKALGENVKNPVVVNKYIAAKWKETKRPATPKNLATDVIMSGESPASDDKNWSAIFKGGNVVFFQEDYTLEVPEEELSKFLFEDIKSGHVCPGCRSLPIEGYDSDKSSWCAFSRGIANLYGDGWKWSKDALEKQPMPSFQTTMYQDLWKRWVSQAAGEVRFFETELFGTCHRFIVYHGSETETFSIPDKPSKGPDYVYRKAWEMYTDD